jgi:2-iminobutanoate/2-iminopropanoate deaminase
LKNLKTILIEAGSGIEDIVKTTIFLTDMKDFKVVNSLYGDIFEETYPARSCFQVVKLPLGGLVEIEAIAKV